MPSKQYLQRLGFVAAMACLCALLATCTTGFPESWWKSAAACGNGLLDDGEGCDDGNRNTGDGCSDNCRVEGGWVCTGEPSVCSAAACGDGLIAGAEECDDNNIDNGDGCSGGCVVENGYECGGQPSVCTVDCGDGQIIQNEACDDGNESSGDGCSATCEFETGWNCTGTPSVCTEICGDNLIVGNEGCDDGNTVPADGCSPSCAIENGWYCQGEPSTCSTQCGDDIAAGIESCDGADHAGQDCTSFQCSGGTLNCRAAGTANECTFDLAGCTDCTAVCGNGLVDIGEECDDQNLQPNDGCDPWCAIETGWTCYPDEPSTCVPTCQDGLVVGNEPCDDNNNTNGDGCDTNCQIENGWTCDNSNPPSVCTPICGDGQILGSEVCDDGNTNDGDGCHGDCMAIDCSNGSTTNCNEDVTLAGSEFVDQQPPAGFVQCAGFINTAGDDVNSDWEAACLGATRTLRVRLWDTTANPWTLLADATLTPDSTPAYEAQFFTPTNHGGTEQFYQAVGGVALYKDEPNSGLLSVVECDWTGDGDSDYGANDAFAINGANTKILYVCSADNDLVNPLCPVEWELFLLHTDFANRCNAGTDPSVWGYTTDLAIALYYQIP